MKKILILIYCLALIPVFANNSLDINTMTAQDVVNIGQQAQNLRMPTDEEIWAVVNSFQFDKAQKEYLFKETKKKFEQMHKNKK